MSKRQYDILVEPAVHAKVKQLPGNIRQRMKRAIKKLGRQPRPHNSDDLDVTDLGVPVDIELRRLQMNKWRLIYAVNDKEKWVWVGAIRKRPPYDYQDLAELVKQLLGF